jgi:vancomycin resistance protein VanJ
MSNPFSSKFVVLLYTAAILLWLLGRFLLSDRLWWLALLNTYSLYLFLPLPFLLLLALFKKLRPLLLPLFIPLVAFLFQYGDLFWPTLQPKPSVTIVTVTSFNVLYSNDNYDALANTIRATSADIIGLQEASLHHQEALNERLAPNNYPYQHFNADYRYGDAAILSRYPIEQVTTFPFPPRELILHATVNVDGRRLHVFVAHLMPTGGMALEGLGPRVTENFGLRAAEIEMLREQMANLDAPAILLCDCNLTPPADTYRTLNTFLTDSFREAGWGLGHTGIPVRPYLPNLYLSRIDYIWHSAGLTATRATVGSAGGSDHLPITAQLYFTP